MVGRKLGFFPLHFILGGFLSLGTQGNFQNFNFPLGRNPKLGLGNSRLGFPRGTQKGRIFFSTQNWGWALGRKLDLKGVGLGHQRKRGLKFTFFSILSQVWGWEFWVKLEFSLVIPRQLFQEGVNLWLRGGLEFFSGGKPRGNSPGGLTFFRR